MLLKSIHLKNIRSYLDNQITFPSGSVLLAGDIGSGKSTILYAIEFGLFGTGELSGDALLRNGASTGSVRLDFELHGKNYSIERSLKRTKQGIAQQAGSFMIDGVKKDAMPTELKADVINLLGYPKELQTKGKNPVYRFTVYTPQEEMKAVLAAKAEDRLNILRKVFGIDKYKRIKQNTTIYARFLRERTKELQGLTADLEEKKKHIEDKQTEMKQAELAMKQVMPQLQLSQQVAADAKKELAQSEQSVSQLNEIRRELTGVHAEIKTKQDYLIQQSAVVERLAREIEESKKELGDSIDAATIEKELVEKQNVISLFEKKCNALRGMIVESTAKLNNHKKVSDDVARLGECPVCLQNVTDDHKNHIAEKAAKDCALLQENVNAHNTTLNDEERQLTAAKKELEAIRATQQQAKVQQVKLQTLDQKQIQKDELALIVEKTKKAIDELQQKKTVFVSQEEQLKQVEYKHLEVKKKCETAIANEHAAQMEHLKAKTQYAQIEQFVKVIQQEIENKEKSKEKLARVQQLHSWLDQLFVPLVGNIEKHVLAKVWRDFNDLFQKWFSVLVEDEFLTARLDDAFTPVITQNGYETNVHNLSGGERTAAALAYRLALNKVINDVVHTIQTKQLLILDEPTDGFSSEQLDKMRDVLEQLAMEQVIVVSHEQQMEAFVDNVLHVHKRDHVSTIA